MNHKILMDKLKLYGVCQASLRRAVEGASQGASIIILTARF